jgi:hypothetical protein
LASGYKKSFLSLEDGIKLTKDQHNTNI